MRICLVAASSRPYDIKIVRDFSAALQEIGYNSIWLSSPLSDKKLDAFAIHNSISIFVRINRLPPAEERKSKYKHISWFQDVFPTTNANIANLQDGDLAVTLGANLGLKIPDKFYAGSMTTYVNPEEFKLLPTKNDHTYDFNLIGFIPRILKQHPQYSDVFVEPLNIIKIKLLTYLSHAAKKLAKGEIYLPKKEGILSLLNFKNFLSICHDEQLPLNKEKYSDFEGYLMRLSNKHHELVRGTLNIQEFEKKIRDDVETDELFNDDLIDFIVREMPRYLDRVFIARELLQVSKNFVIAGQNWKNYGLFKNNAIGEIGYPKSLELFRNSKITLQNNNHGLGIHSRTLSCMATGGFVFSHSSPRDYDAGGLKTAFEPGVHYGEFTEANIKSEANRWLQDDIRRLKVAENAKKKVLNEFTWKQGAIHFAKCCQL